MAFKSHWRMISERVIREVLERTKNLSDGAVAQSLRVAYPFGERAGYPYKIWLAEIKRQRALGKPPDLTEGGPNLFSDSEEENRPAMVNEGADPLEGVT